MLTSRLRICLLAIRPKTLSASVAPVVLGTLLAWRLEGWVHLSTAVLCLLAAIAIQSATNLANDYFDYKKGADANDRLGPPRVTAAGLVAPETMKRAFILAFALAAALSVPLILRGGWPILIIAILSILSGILYTAGPRPLGYLGLGEIFVLIFFGPVAVAGTYYVQTLGVNPYLPYLILSGLGTGFLSMAILIVNNLRDIDSDRRAGKKTLAVRFGRDFAQCEYLFAILVASSLAIWLNMAFGFGFFGSRRDTLLILTIVIFIVSLLIIPPIHTVFTKSDGPSLNKALAYTSLLLTFYPVVFFLRQWLQIRIILHEPSL